MFLHSPDLSLAQAATPYSFFILSSYTIILVWLYLFHLVKIIKPLNHHHIKGRQVCIITMVAFKSCRMTRETTGQTRSLAIPYHLLRQVYNLSFNSVLYWEVYIERFLECSPMDHRGHITIEQRLGQKDISSPWFWK